jgi:hypothetical protein
MLLRKSFAQEDAQQRSAEDKYERDYRNEHASMPLPLLPTGSVRGHPGVVVPDVALRHCNDFMTAKQWACKLGTFDHGTDIGQPPVI